MATPAQTKKFEFLPFSEKQQKIMSWWAPDSPVNDYDGIIADGAIRSGKTMSMSLSFTIWGMMNFNNQKFIMAGKSISSFRRNVLVSLKEMLTARGYDVQDKRSENLMVVRDNLTTNSFYVFGGQDESSQDTLQGLTAAGALLDEVALMPISFVNQAVARCSVDGAKLWFNCNPEGPMHPFKVDWIDKRVAKRLLYLHFVFDDNPSLSERRKESYKRNFNGVFYERFVLGRWCMAEGVIYRQFDAARHVINGQLPRMRTHLVSVDYGHTNATVFLLGGIGEDGRLYIIAEDIHEAASEGDRSPRWYSQAMVRFIRKNCEGLSLEKIIVDPAAKGFIVQLREDGVARVENGYNPVIEGIQLTQSMFSAGLLRIHASCKYLASQLQSYVWDPKAQERGEDKPLEVNDHAPDALRYMVMAYRSEWKRRVTNAV